MQNDLPIPMNVSLKFEDYFNPNSKVHKNNILDREGIALVEDTQDKLYYVIIYHDSGFVIVNYSQSFEDIFGALVIYKKFKFILYKGILKQYWENLLSRSRDRHKLK